MDITQLILDDHHEQRRLFAVLQELDRSDTRRLAPIWQRLATFLEVHAAAEEAIFYPVLLKEGKGTGKGHDPKAETKDAIGDHNEIRDAVAAVAKEKVGSDAWFEAIAKANKANGEHMDEEEREGLRDVREHVARDERHEMAIAFAAFEAMHVTGVQPVDIKPDDYIAENA
jgi:hemerythrin-like domain-containing protein